MGTSVLRTATLRLVVPVRPAHTSAVSPSAPHSRERRALNVVVALVGILVTLPLMMVIAILVKLTSHGPVLYRQARVGLDRRSPRRPSGNLRRFADYGGRPFTMYKFRTMRVHQGQPQVWATQCDPRVTPIGRWLRRLRLDELPQLFNVLAGDMNVVGPRPEQPTIALNLLVLVEGYRGRQRVLPGITGLAQIRLSYDQTLDDVRRKVALDLEYVSRMSALEDLKIMLRTIPVMLGARKGW